jgi:hypothetical protein
VISVHGAFLRHLALGRLPYLASDMGTDFTDLVAQARRVRALINGLLRFAAQRVRH